jgi:hypothetical protein
MGKGLKFLTFFGELQHPHATIEIDLQRILQRIIKIYGSSAIND